MHRSEFTYTNIYTSFWCIAFHKLCIPKIRFYFQHSISTRIIKDWIDSKKWNDVCAWMALTKLFKLQVQVHLQLKRNTQSRSKKNFAANYQLLWVSSKWFLKSIVSDGTFDSKTFLDCSLVSRWWCTHNLPHSHHSQVRKLKYWSCCRRRETSR